MWFPFFRGRRNVARIERLAVARAVGRVVEEYTKYSYGARNVRELEAVLSDKFNALVLGVGSGTDALILSLKALNIRPGDEVLVPAFGCIPIASSVSWVGATPVFVDVREIDYAIAPNKIEESITPKTKAIIVAHLFGQATRSIFDVSSIAKMRGLFVIEDAAQSFGAKIEINGEWKATGTIGDIGCLSFSSTKLFSTPGSGGAVVVREPHLREEIRRMRLYGAKIRDYDYPTIGINASLHEIHAAALLAKLPFLKYWLQHRRKLAERYAEILSGVRDIILPHEEEGTRCTWYRYVIRTKNRDLLFQHLQATFRSIPRLKPAIQYPVSLPYFSVFKSGCAKGDFPVADRISSEVITLPLNDSMSLNDVDRVCAAVKNFNQNSLVY